jgi:hypothetical protein
VTRLNANDLEVAAQILRVGRRARADMTSADIRSAEKLVRLGHVLIDWEYDGWQNFKVYVAGRALWSVLPPPPTAPNVIRFTPAPPAPDPPGAASGAVVE